ncbi:uncharacterized protein LOC102676338 [Apis dorsata]|uniref:uncharacterized protein LOC102676338 n=1 Tax=Apis dorsata TaxID=7462 RepID=UPI0003DF69CF|nr:uncharacterized protein LOC102676338 [Apis dorsata]
MYRPDYIIPWVEMRARDENIRKAFKCYPVLEPFAPRHSISYFNNNKEDSTKWAYERLHKVDGFDPGKPRCDRIKQSLIWLEISRENKGLKIPMITSHSYGRPNRVQIDVPDKKYHRSSKLKEFYSRSGFELIIDEEKQEKPICLN